MSLRVAIVGAGMAGLAAAYEASRHPGCELTLFEASGRLGGTIETVHHSTAAGEYVIECGPDSWVSDKPWARELALELGLGDELIYSNDATRRTYLAQPGPSGRTLVPMPDGMRMMVPTRWEPLLASPLFSEEARQAYLAEPGRAAELRAHALAAGNDADESVSSFVRRHFGEEATETIAGPLLAGVFGGDIETLSARATLAPFVRMERERGSLVDAVMARANVPGAQPQPLFTTLRSGLGTLVDRIADELPAGAVRTGVAAKAMAREGSSWRLETTEGPDCYDAVVLATPAHTTRTLMAPLDAAAARLLDVEATTAVIVALLFDPVLQLDVPRGFGFLVPPGKALEDDTSLLAGTFMNQKFNYRAPDGATFLRGYFGGLAASRMLALTDEQIAEAACRRFAELLGPLPEPSFALVRRWPLSLPQYAVGHLHRMAEFEQRVRTLPGLSLVGNAYEGVGLPNLVDSGRRAVRNLLQPGCCGAAVGSKSFAV